MPGAELRAVDVTAGYGDAPVVRGVSLDVRPGEVVVVVGPNGHGKTTLMRALTGLLDLDAGEVTLDGQRIDGHKAEDLTRHGIVHVPQGDGLFPELTVEENLLMGAYPKAAWGRRGEALDRAMELFPRLRERRTQQARTLSGGERRMVALGRGLMREPKLLIVDEPSLGLAPVVIEAVYDTLSRVVGEGTSLLLVEESFAHIEGVADRVCVLEMGQIVRTGPVAEVAADETVAQSYLGVLK